MRQASKRQRGSEEGKAEDRYSVASQGQLFRWKFLRHKAAVVSLVVLVLLYLICIFAEFFSPSDPNINNGDLIWAPPQRIRMMHEGRLHAPFVYGLIQKQDPRTYRTTYTLETTTPRTVRLFFLGDPYRFWGIFPGTLHLFGAEGGIHLFGTDGMGRDLLTRCLYGGRLSLSIGLIGVLISFFIGIFFGGISGYFGGHIDNLIQRLIEFIRSIPTMPLWMALSVALPPHWPPVRVYFGIVVILSLVGWTGLARVVRSKFLALREEDFVMAARLSGAGEAKVIFRHMLPSFSSHIIANLTLSIPGMILGETSLSFLGLGLQPPAVSWGVLLKDAQKLQVLAHSPWLLIPAIFVVVSVLAFNFVGDGLRDAADPYAKV